MRDIKEQYLTDLLKKAKDRADNALRNINNMFSLLQKIHKLLVVGGVKALKREGIL